MKPLVDEIATGQKQVIQQNSSLRDDVRQLRRQFESNMFVEQMTSVLRDEIKKAQCRFNQCKISPIQTSDLVLQGNIIRIS